MGTEAVLSRCGEGHPELVDNPSLTHGCRFRHAGLDRTCTWDRYVREWLYDDRDLGGQVDPGREAVDHPSHYGGADDPYEAVKVIEAWELPWHLGDCVKYIARHGKKDPTKTLEDLRKARWYLDRYISRLEARAALGEAPRSQVP